MYDKPAVPTSLCPTCGDSMRFGWLVMWNPIFGQKIRWQPVEPGYRRLRVPEGAEVVLKAQVGGKDPRVAYRCTSCATMVVPPDEYYDLSD